MVLDRIGKLCPGGKLPNDYIVFDLETTGRSIYSDRAIELGFVGVSDRKIAFELSWLVNWNIAVPPDATAKNHITTEMAMSGKWGPRLLPMLHPVLEDWASRYVFVGHNLMKFDVPLFRTELAKLGLKWNISEDQMIDTLGMARAVFLKEGPSNGETLGGFMRRMVNKPVGGFSMDTLTVDLKLERHLKAGETTHRAGPDCRLEHYLLEELRNGG